MLVLKRQAMNPQADPYTAAGLDHLDRQRKDRDAWNRIPLGVQGALKRYFEDRIWPGDTTSAILAGDLFAAYRLADELTKRAMFDIAEWIHLHAPIGAYGSPDAVSEWLAGREVE